MKPPDEDMILAECLHCGERVYTRKRANPDYWYHLATENRLCWFIKLPDVRIRVPPCAQCGSVAHIGACACRCRATPCEPKPEPVADCMNCWRPIHPGVSGNVPMWFHDHGMNWCYEGNGMLRATPAEVQA